ncbi:ATP-dependent RNA helicase DDX5/DBP2 [Pancytospora philotis]|nr:ATP-dependent RNA helicase DDX5/DBP2 [Pancytospora philotis]
MFRSRESEYGDNRRGGNRDSYGGGRGGRREGRSFGGRGDRGDSFEPVRTENEPVPFEKNFYCATKTLTREEAEELRAKASMKLIGSDINLPVNDFTSLGFPQSVVDSFRAKGFTAPTPIQAQGWPMALSGRDMVGIADTGSGKTLSFVLPALIHAAAQQPLRERDGPIVLILAPTRELCNQIEEVVAEYATYFNMRSVAVYGGASMVPQKKAIMRGSEILVATPGRLIDLHDQGFCPLSRVSFLVLDEADRMLDMGFEPQLQKIIPKTSPQRQTLMWSATWPREVRRLAGDFMKDFIQVNIGDDQLKANIKITQKVDVVHWQDKKDKLLSYLEGRKDDRIIIFCNMKRTCDTIEDFLIEHGYNAVAIHGDKAQNARDAVISSFKNGRKNILIATDVAARGLDVKDVKLVINLDFPKVVDDYVHRIGRTARGSSNEGLAFTMICDDDRDSVNKLIEILRESNQEVPDELRDMAARRGGRGGSSGRGGYGGGRGGSSFGGGRSGRRFGY